MSSQSEIVEESVFVSGTAGKLECVLTYPGSGDIDAIIMIVGPHPLLGGDFDNNVVYQLSNQLSKFQMIMIRFNYRGVGQSEGDKVITTDNISQFLSTSHINEEDKFGEDVTSVGQYMGRHIGDIDCIIGYSFGAYLASQWASENGNVKSIVMISPTIEKHDYKHLADLDIPKLIISSLDDFAVPVGHLDEWYSQCKEPKKMIAEKMDNHFFRGYENWLSENILDFLKGVI